jgi:hypothetical protein
MQTIKEKRQVLLSGIASLMEHGVADGYRSMDLLGERNLTIRDGM